MLVVIKHRDIEGIYLCNEGIHWYWGPREKAKEYSTTEVRQLLASFPSGWEGVIGVPQEEVTLEVERLPDTLPAPPALN